MSFIKLFKNKKNGKKNSKQTGKGIIEKANVGGQAMSIGGQAGEMKKTKKKNFNSGKIDGKPVVSGGKKIGYAPIAYKTIKFPHITEKSANLAGFNKYVFRVLPDVNKIEIAKSIAGFYGVKVKNVNIINIHRKKRFSRRHKGYKSGYKKAIVTLKPGEKIEALHH